MLGAIAAGSRQAAEAGAWALREGGTAVDAAVAAVFGAFVAEGPLTGPAGGGFILLRSPAGELTALDCFFAVPSASRAPMDEVVIDFGDASTQVFHVGAGSVAVPGLVAGLAAAHARGGRLPWRRLLDPAIELGRAGITTTAEQAFLHEILTPILQRERGGQYLYGTPGLVRTDVLVPALKAIAARGTGAVEQLLDDLVDDLAEYRVVEREPLETVFADAVVVATPAPSMGGAVVIEALGELERHPAGGPGTLEEARATAAALARGYGITDARPGGAKPTGTTNVSVIDGDGGVAAISSTLGSGSGVFTDGFQLNNMLGELDVIGDTPRPAGSRLPSMMTPTIALVDGRPRLVVGSAGSVRLAGAIAQVLAAVVRRGLEVETAIERPRLHVDPGVVHVEGGWDAQVADGLERDGWSVLRWADRNLFFGGVSAVEIASNGRLGAAGDPRRGGVGLVVG